MEISNSFILHPFHTSENSFHQPLSCAEKFNVEMNAEWTVKMSCVHLVLFCNLIGTARSRHWQLFPRLLPGSLLPRFWGVSLGTRLTASELLTLRSSFKLCCVCVNVGSHTVEEMSRSTKHDDLWIIPFMYFANTFDVCVCMFSSSIGTVAAAAALATTLFSL